MVTRERASHPEPSRFPAALTHFVRFWNDERFWECHEVLEGPWRRNRSPFYHGLILAASAYVHVQRENPHGIQAQFRKALKTLELFRPYYLGVEVEELVSWAREGIRVTEEIGAGSRPSPASWSRVVPPRRLELMEERIRGTEPELSAADRPLESTHDQDAERWTGAGTGGDVAEPGADAPSGQKRRKRM